MRDGPHDLVDRRSAVSIGIDLGARRNQLIAQRDDHRAYELIDRNSAIAVAIADTREGRDTRC